MHSTMHVACGVRWQTAAPVAAAVSGACDDAEQLVLSAKWQMLFGCVC
jgi:hypothetical protein